MCHRHYVAEEEPLRERIEEAEPEFDREPAEGALELEEEPEEERKPAIPTPSDD